MKILVVDDNEAICSGLCELLERGNPNYNCESASDGNEALIKAKAIKPDVVILDFSMPGMDGLSSARLISHRLPGTKILLHTARNNDMLEANATGMGFFGLWTRQMEETCLPSSAKSTQIQKGKVDGKSPSHPKPLNERYREHSIGIFGKSPHAASKFRAVGSR